MNRETGISKIVASRIKLLRGNETQKELAEKLGVSPQAVSDWENANKLPRMGIIEKLSLIYNVPKSYILGESNTDWGFSLASVPKRLKMLREEKGLSKMELTELIDMPFTKYRYYESGMKVSPDDIIVFASFYNVSIDYLLGITDTRKSASPNNTDGFILINEGVITKYNELSLENKKIIDKQIQYLLHEQSQEGSE